MPLFVTIEPVTVATVLAVFLLGGMVKGALGFGLPLTTMAILPFIIPVDMALAVNVVMLFATNIAQFVQMGQMRATFRRFGPVLWGIVIGVPLGAAMVSAFSDNVLLAALGGIVVAFAILSVAAPDMALPPQRERSAGWATGIAAGVVGALTTVGGPLFVMYLVGLRVDRRTFLSGLSLFFILSALLISGAFWAVGIFDLERLVLSALSLPAALLGMGAGNWLGARVPAHRFRTVVLAALGILGLNLLWRGLTGG